MEQRTWTLLRELSAKIPSVRIPVASLSGGQRQTVAIARSLIGEPRVVILDEPTAALGVAQTAEVLNLIERLRERGHGVVLISHNMADVMAVADRVVVLRLGRNNGVYNVADVTSETLIAAITGAVDNAVTRPRRAASARRRAEPPDGQDHPRCPTRAAAAIAATSAAATHEPAGEARGARRAADATTPEDARSLSPRRHPRRRRSPASRGSAAAISGSLPVIVGLVVIWTVFQVAQPGVPLEPATSSNLTMQCAAIGTIALGIVLVLLARRDRPVGRLRVGPRRGRPRRRVRAAAVEPRPRAGRRRRRRVPRRPALRIPLHALRAAELRDHARRTARVPRAAAVGARATPGSIGLPFDSWIVQFAQQMFLPAVGVVRRRGRSPSARYAWTLIAARAAARRGEPREPELPRDRRCAAARCSSFLLRRRLVSQPLRAASA